MRAWYNGSTSASQAEDEGSIPFARTKNRIDLVLIMFLDCGVGREPDKEGSKPSRFHKRNAVKSSRVARRHLCRGIPFARTKRTTMLNYNYSLSETFDWYLSKVLPAVERNSIQPKYGYHGLYTHTSAVVFRGIDYALTLKKSPNIVALACAFHDMARITDGDDISHGNNAVPLAIRTMSEIPYVLTRQERESILYAIRNHTIGMVAPDYVSACLWDADRTRISWECGFDAKFFTTDRAKQVAAGSPDAYLQFMQQALPRRALSVIGTPNKQY